MDGSNYSQPGGSGPPPQMVGYFQGMPGYNPSGGPAPSSSPTPGALGSSPGARQGSSISIWAGDLDAYMDENFLRQAVAASGWAQDITRIKVVRDHYTGMHAGYGFLDAASPEAAERVIATGSGLPIPGTNRCWRLNMGRNAAVHTHPGSAAGTEINIYVGNLEPSVTDYQLMTAFRPRYTSVRHAKVVCNEYGQSRGFGFVRFANPQDAERAVSEMQGFEFNSKPIRLSPATGRNRGPGAGRGGGGGGGYNNHGQPPHSGGHGAPNNKRPRQVMSPDDPNNTTIFIGGTGNHITEDLLWREFSAFGELDAVRVPVNKTGFAFVRFKRREDAQRAKEELSGSHYVTLNPNKPVRVEWASEQIAITKPPPVQNMPLMYSSGGAAQTFDPQYNPSTYNNSPGVNQAPGQHPFGSYSSPSGQANNSSSMPTTSSTPATGAQPSMNSTANGVTKNDESSTGNDMTSGASPAKDGATAKADAHGETEPPSKRAAVGRPEYTGSGADNGVKEGLNDTKAAGVADDSPAMQFSWLNASSTQPASNPQ